jgi:alpha/beta superfamily hydrolase
MTKPTMREEFRFLDLRGERVFAGVHHPTSTPSHVLAIYHPLGEEKLWAHRVLVSLARDLAASGVAVVRIDFRGEGDSDRDFEQTDFETRIEDAERAMDELRDLYPSTARAAMLGLRFGACVAAAAAARRSDVSDLVLLDPPTDGAAYMQAVLRLNLMAQMAIHHKVIEAREALVARLRKGDTVNIEGYELSWPFFQQASDFRLRAALRGFHGHTTIVQIIQEQATLRQDLADLAQEAGRCRVEVVQEEPFWREIKTFYRRADALTHATLHALGIAR